MNVTNHEWIQVECLNNLLANAIQLWELNIHNHNNLKKS